MELFEMIKDRRSIRKYLNKPVEKEKLIKIMEAGTYAPSPGGGQSTKIIMLSDFNLIEQIGIINANCENRNWGGRKVNDEQPSIIDDLSIKSGFYGCPNLAIVCAPKKALTMVNGIGGAFVVAENMVLEAMELGVSSCIVGRGEATYNNEEFQKIYRSWKIEEDYIPIVFVCLGYIDGPYPKSKAIKEGRMIFIED